VGKKHVIQNVDDFEGESYERVITQARLGDEAKLMHIFIGCGLSKFFIPVA
jgi:hypothetical protein